MYKKTKKIYYRKFTESLPKGFIKNLKKVKKRSDKLTKELKLTFHLQKFVLFFFLLFSIFLVFQVITSYLNFQKTRQYKLEVADNFSYWSEILSKHPNSPDANYNAAKYSYEMGNENLALKLIKKAIELDPSFEKAIELREEILR